jgi:hypothetical protein
MRAAVIAATTSTCSSLTGRSIGGRADPETVAAASRSAAAKRRARACAGQPVPTRRAETAGRLRSSAALIHEGRRTRPSAGRRSLQGRRAPRDGGRSPGHLDGHRGAPAEPTQQPSHRSGVIEATAAVGVLRPARAMVATGEHRFRVAAVTGVVVRAPGAERLLDLRAHDGERLGTVRRQPAHCSTSARHAGLAGGSTCLATASPCARMHTGQPQPHQTLHRS